MNLKKSVCLFLFTVCLLPLVDAQKGQVGLTFSAFSDNDVARFKSIEDDSRTDAGKSFTYGLTYLKPLNKWLDLETGLEFRSCSIVRTSIMVDPVRGIFSLLRSETMSLLSLPATVRANFLHYFFVNAGFLLDADLSSNSIVASQTGIGTLFGLGLKYDFKNGISAFVNPIMKVHSFPLSFHQNQEHFLESTVRFGITYKLK